MGTLRARLGVPSGALWVYEGDFGTRRGHFGKTLLSFLANEVTSSHSRWHFVIPWVYFVVIFGYFGYMKTTSSQYESKLESISSYLGYTSVRFQKTVIFPTDFNEFIKDVFVFQSFLNGSTTCN